MMSPITRVTDGFRQGLLIALSKMQIANRDRNTGRLTRFELEHTAAERMAFDFRTEFRERRAPAALKFIHGDTWTKGDSVEGIGANARRFIADEMRARATHD